MRVEKIGNATLYLGDCMDIVALHGGSVEIEAAIRARSQQ